MERVTITTHSAEETRQLAARIAPKVPLGACIALCGEMGAGKTVFVQGLARGLGLNCAVTSPTFSLMNIYGDSLYHFDLYRLGEEEIAETGFEEFFGDPRHISVVEWPHTAYLPAGFLQIDITATAPETRRIELPAALAE